MTDRLFGTDGIRSAAGAFPLDEASLLKLGAVIAALLPAPRVLIARDTRESGPAIESLLTRGLGRGARVSSAGVLTTPGLAFLTRELHFDLGVMISASHNPFSDNGIKIFSRRGEKLSALMENRISSAFAALKRVPGARPRPAAAIASDVYVDFLRRQGLELAGGGLKIAVDCANGAAAPLVPLLFRGLGLDIVPGFDRPNGRNINRGCGSTYPAALRELVRQNDAGLGIAFDGDADRVIFADARGRILAGDHALFLIARYLRETEPRFNGKVVGTVMSNLGLERAFAGMGIEFLRADVGDKYVFRLMKKSGAILGGEPSGHVILRHRQPTGDGPLTALFLMKALRFFACDAAAALDQLPLFPQQTLDIRIRRKKELKGWEELRKACGRFARQYGRQARLLVRYSGTEPKVRVMIEARDQDTIEKNMPVFRSLLEKEIGE
jgi:phosphoglucosamine mutase